MDLSGALGQSTDTLSTALAITLLVLLPAGLLTGPQVSWRGGGWLGTEHAVLTRAPLSLHSGRLP